MALGTPRHWTDPHRNVGLGDGYWERISDPGADHVWLQRECERRLQNHLAPQHPPAPMTPKVPDFLSNKTLLLT